MQLQDAPLGLPDLEKAIDRNPLAIAPHAPVIEAIALMSQHRSQSCPLGQSEGESREFGARSSCVLAIENDKILGIFTERDLVRLTVAESAQSKHSAKQIARLTVAEVMSHPVITLRETHFQDIFAALFLYRRYRIRHLPITDEADRPVGIVSPESIRQVLQPANLLKMRRVGDVMSKHLVCAPPDASVLEVAQQMVEYRVSCVAIAHQDRDERWQPLGIITERDLVQFQFLQLDLAALPVTDVMSTPLFLLSPEDSLWTAHQEMQKRRVRRLVVSWNWGRNLGIVTQTRLLRAFDPMEMYWTLESLQQTVQQFQEKYGEAGEPSLLSADEPAETDVAPHSAAAQCYPLLHSLRDCLEHLASHPNRADESSQLELKRAIADLGQLEHLLR